MTREEPEVLALKAHLDKLRADPALAGHPLMAELDKLAEAHVRLQHRIRKITRISDGFQVLLKELNESLLRVSRTDSLTELPNRRAMMEELHSERLRALREGAPMAVLMADVDRFKSINDSYGHDVGDRVLCALAKALKEALRAYDVCARWGGEEFLVLLPATAREGAVEVAEKLRKAAASLSVPEGEARISVGLSVGCALLGKDETLDSLLRRADTAMYVAKHLGGDRVEGELPYLGEPGNAC